MKQAEKTGKVSIRGSGLDTVLLIDGERPANLLSFSVHGDGPDKPTRLILELAVRDLELEGDFEIEERNV